MVPPAVAASQPVAKPQRRKREHAAGRDGDRPRHRQAGARLVDVVEKQQDRDDAGRRCQQRATRVRRARARAPRASRSSTNSCLNACRSTENPPRATKTPKPVATSASARSGAGSARPRRERPRGKRARNQHMRALPRRPRAAASGRRRGEDRSATAPKPAAQETPTTAAADRAAPSAMNAASSRGRPSRVCPAAKGAWELHKRGIGTPSAIANTTIGACSWISYWHCSGRPLRGRQLSLRSWRRGFRPSSSRRIRCKRTGACRILTNQPAAPTRLVGIWQLDHEGSVAEYQQLAHAAIDEALSGGKTPIVVGGTGSTRAPRCRRWSFRRRPPPGNASTGSASTTASAVSAPTSCSAERDPAAAASVHPNDRRRVVRALELTDAGSVAEGARRPALSADTRHPTAGFGLEVPRTELLRRIEARTQAHVRGRGARRGAQALAWLISATAAQGARPRRTSRALGDREAAEALSLRSTRRYAAYQRKRMRRIPGLVSVAADRPPGEVAR